ncbi:MAG: cohesin domain-containing protein [Cellulosimicrobium cellulans]
MTRSPSRRRLGRRAALVGGLAVAATALTVPAHAAPSASDATLDAPSTAEVGTSITVTVATTGAVDLYAYDLAVAYDPDLVELVEDSAVTPDGGFSDVVDDGGTVAVAHTRLGTSPGLEGDVTLVTLTFTAVADGDAPFTVPTATLVGADATTASLTDLASATTTITAAVTAPPTDDPTDGATSPTPGGDDTTAPGADDASDSPSTSAGSGSLASTGASVAWFAGAALLAVTVGVVILWARRRAVASR